MRPVVYGVQPVAGQARSAVREVLCRQGIAAQRAEQGALKADTDMQGYTADARLLPRLVHLRAC